MKKKGKNEDRGKRRKFRTWRIVKIFVVDYKMCYYLFALWGLLILQDPIQGHLPCEHEAILSKAQFFFYYYTYELHCHSLSTRLSLYLNFLKIWLSSLNRLGYSRKGCVFLIAATLFSENLASPYPFPISNNMSEK